MFLAVVKILLRLWSTLHLCKIIEHKKIYWAKDGLNEACVEQIELWMTWQERIKEV